MKKEEQNTVNILVGFVECFGPKRDYHYMSTPITSGPNLYDVLEKHNVTDRKQLPGSSFFEEVIKPNIYQAQKTVSGLRMKFKKVINPAELDIMKGILDLEVKWGQAVYMDLWEKTIGRYVSRMIFNDGWNYSEGCVGERIIAMEKEKKNGMAVPLDINGNAITLPEFYNQVSEAIDSIRSRGLNADNLEKLLKKAKKI